MGWDNSFETIIVLPTGATSGERIVIDGQNGTISVYGADGNLAVQILPDGSITSYGIDPQSGEGTQAIMQDGQFNRTMTGLPFQLYPSYMGIGYNGFGTSVGTYYHAAAPIVGGLEGSAPSIDMTSESSFGAADADLEIASDNIRILAKSWTMNNGPELGMGIYARGSRTSNMNFGAETVVMTTNSMTWKAGRAYQVEFLGLANAPAADWARCRIRKGTTTAGTVWRDQIDFNSNSASTTNTCVNFRVNLVNNTGADITSAIALTANQGSVSQTWQWAASTSAVSYITVEDIGSASDWPGSPIS